MPMPRGEGHYVTKKSGMTDAKVREMRRLHRVPCAHCGQTMSMADLSRRYGVSTGMVWKILNGESWKHVTDEPIAQQPVPGVYPHDQ